MLYAIIASDVANSWKSAWPHARHTSNACSN